jgi:hypothetical protein
MYIGLHLNYMLFLSHFKDTWIFLDRFSESTQISNLTKICSVGAELFHAAEWKQADMKKVIVVFLSFAKAPKMPMVSSETYNNVISFKICGLQGRFLQQDIGATCYKP